MTDEQQIRELQNRYCECFDARDAEGFAALYLEHGLVVAPWGQEIRGRDKLRKAVLNTPPGGWHKVLETEIAVEGEDAKAVCRFQAQGADHIVDFGRYEDTYRRTAAGWMIATRRVIVESRPYNRAMQDVKGAG